MELPPGETSCFITGTDTGAGKTRVAATLLAKLRERGIDAVPMKPVQTGCELRNGRLAAPDLEFCLRHARLEPAPEDEELMCPYKFQPACSPHLAARLAGTEIAVDTVATAYRRLAGRHQGVLVEGAGGVLVPLNGRETMLDLMRRLNLPVVLAARPGLGTINHTLLSLQCLRGAGLRVLGIVFCETAPVADEWLVADNIETIARLGGTPILGRLAFDAAEAGMEA